MKTNYNERREVRERDYLKEMYQTMISGKVETQELEKMASYLVKGQKADGSWSVIDDYKVDSDIRVAYAYMPTYFATAALIAADLKVNFKKGSIEKNALVSGLIFATGRNLVGHGYDATASLLEAIAIYKNAGVYKWMRENREFAEEFCNMFEEHIQTFRHLVESGRTVSDWNRDFRNSFLRSPFQTGTEILEKNLKKRSQIMRQMQIHMYGMQHTALTSTEKDLWNTLMNVLIKRNQRKIVHI